MVVKKTCSAVAGLLFAFSAAARDEDYVETTVFSRTVSVAFNGSSATVGNEAGSGVTCSQSGAALILSNTVKQVAFKLSGTTTGGAVKIYSDHPFKLELNGVSIASSIGPAIDIQTKGVCYVVLPKGTASSLTDCATYVAQYDATNGLEDAKGVFFSEGQLVFSGTGSLSVNGVCAEKHGICSDDYVRVLDGDIRVSMTKKKSDGVHVNDHFQMDGGRLAIALALKGDGIDADDDGSIAINGGEIAIALSASESRGIKCSTNTFEVAGGAITIASAAAASACNGLSANGTVTLGGGLVAVSMSGTNCHAIESDQAFVSSGGSLAVTASGPECKGIKTDGDAVFNGGTFRFELSGDVVLETKTNASSVVYKDPSYTEAVKASNVVVNAGTFSVLSTGLAGRGFSAESDLTVNGGTFSIASGGSATATFTNEALSADVAAAACMKADRTMKINGGTFTCSTSGSAGKGFVADASLLVTGGTVNLDLSGAPAFVNHGSYLEPSYCAGVKCGGSAVFSNGTFTIRHTGIAGRGLSVDTNLTVAGGSFAITTTGTNTAVYTSGVYYVSGALSNYLDVGAASAVKVDGNAVIGGGAFDLLSTGCCGKGLSVGGVLTVGTNAIAATPSVTARTTGTQFKISGGSTSTGGGGPGGGGAPPDDTADYSNPKAIKVTGKLIVNSGTVVASTLYSGGEGLESKDSILVSGGSIESTCYDDCMNAASNITVTGGTIFCSASNNDGIDSNGTFLFTGGVIASFGTTAPEEGIDNDSNTFTVNGGTFVGCGGATSYPNAGSQYAVVYTGSLSSNTVMRIANASGSIFAFKMPRTYSGSVALLCSCPSIASSGTYTVYTGSTMSGADFHGLYTNSVSSASGGTSKGSKSSATSHYYAIP